VREIDVHELDALLAEGAVLVDVREPSEFAEVHVPGAELIPMADLAVRHRELDRTQPVHVICRSGHRSAAVCEALTAQGFDAVNVVGGTIAWVRAGKPYEQGL
jgi:rhodanese-related sulfurtransferase